MPTFTLSLNAQRDIASISEYIAARNITAAIKMINRIEKACQMLAENPALGEVREGFGVPGCRSLKKKPLHRVLSTNWQWRRYCAHYRCKSRPVIYGLKQVDSYLSYIRFLNRS
jgi:plasmid stabilization system protein ParE